ncbi:response regulator [Paenibacillus sp. YN15]|uniref:response regulator n=1 Tax=Paenibacillus sp. YN15 TaxID=1742774 RepID=UPI0015ECC04E|nr:response regulator [Paenibacillus sp. YN15]
MYKLIIVDDEEEIRDGLSELVDWTSLGFVVAKKLEDGSHAIRYLQEHHVDAVLTDVKMTYASGIDLAQYVREHKPDTKVVILSGFQEFALARDAIRYHVSHYLLKPTDLDEVANVFRQIAAELDEAARKRELDLRQSRDINSLRPLMMEQFFFSLLAGAPWGQNIEELQGRLRQSGLPVDPLNGKVSEMKAEWSMAHQAVQKNVDRHTISAAITKEKEQIYYTCIHVSDNRFVIIGSALVPMSEHDLLKRTEQYFMHVQNTFLSLLGVSIRLESLKLYEGLSALLESYHEQRDLSPGEPVTAEEEQTEREKDKDRIIIREAKQYIMDHFEMDLALTDVARHVGLNPVYFSRLFKQETGKNYSDFVISIRIQKAMEYLKDPFYKVYEIGHLVGYKNTKYFHKLFKRQTGLTPSEYRDQL